MKTETLILLGLAYWWYSRQSGGVHFPDMSTIYPGGSSRSTGSGGTTASGAGISGSFTNPPVSGSPGNSAWTNPSGFITCSDGTIVTDPSLCPADPSGYITCADGSLVNDASLCPENQGYTDTGDPCDPNSWAYDPGTCGSMTAGGL